jgi:hypothetical protein
MKSQKGLRFRRRHKLEGRSAGGKLTLKDLFSFVLSAAAFAISGITFYFNVLNQTDELRAVVDQLPRIEIDSFQDSLGVVIDASKEMRVLLINSGNRSVAVREIGLRLIVIDANSPSTGECRGTNWPGEGAHYVLEGKSAQTAKVKIRFGGAFDDEVMQEGEEYSFKVSRKNFVVRVCAYIAVATPSTGYASREFEVLQTSNVSGHRWNISEDKTAAPILVHRHRGTIFGN